jgi:hypothetical protein
VGNPVANRQKWRNGHEGVAACQTKELSNFTLNFRIFSIEPIFHYLRLMAVLTVYLKFTCFEEKNFVKGAL